MSDIAIRVDRLSKRYEIAATKNRHDTLADRIKDTLTSAFRRVGNSHSHDQEFWALKDVSFEVRQGQVVGIVGHNGAGKSTLLKILSHITVPSAGTAEILGRVGSLLEVGTGFHPELTGRENIFLNGAIIGMKKEEIRRRFDEIVAFAEIDKFLDVPVKRYSSGMYVRLGFAVAAHLEPEILLVDEVLAVGDAAFQKKCLDKIRETAKGGRTVLFISHNMIAVNSLCERVIWVNSGRIVEDGPTAEVVTRYLTKSLKGGDVLEELWNNADEAPGNENVKLHRVRVRRQDGNPNEPLTMQTPFQVEVEYWNLVSDAHLHITIHLYTADHVIAFTTWSSNDRPMKPGLFRSVCFVPGDLLNSGSHRFTILVVKDTNAVVYNHESCVPLNIIDVRERQGTWYGKEPGVVQPVLKWTTECLSENFETCTLPENQCSDSKQFAGALSYLRNSG